MIYEYLNNKRNGYSFTMYDKNHLFIEETVQFLKRICPTEYFVLKLGSRISSWLFFVWIMDNMHGDIGSNNSIKSCGVTFQATTTTQSDPWNTFCAFTELCCPTLTFELQKLHHFAACRLFSLVSLLRKRRWWWIKNMKYS